MPFAIETPQQIPSWLIEWRYQSTSFPCCCSEPPTSWWEIQRLFSPAVPSIDFAAIGWETYRRPIVWISGIRSPVKGRNVRYHYTFLASLLSGHRDLSGMKCRRQRYLTSPLKLNVYWFAFGAGRRFSQINECHARQKEKYWMRKTVYNFNPWVM